MWSKVFIVGFNFKAFAVSEMRAMPVAVQN